MSGERALNFDQWKTFFENYKPIRVWLWFVYKFTENVCHLRLFSNFIQTLKRYPYPNLNTTCHIKLKFFLWTKLLQNVIFVKYHICCCSFNNSSHGTYVNNFCISLLNFTEFLTILPNCSICITVAYVNSCIYFFWFYDFLCF